MSVTRRIAFGAAASWFGRGINIVLGLALLPVLFRHLPSEELGLWLLLGQSWATMGILDLGFGVTFTRRIALLRGKAGGDPDAPLPPEVSGELADLIACGRRVYRIMAGAVFVLATASGFFYLRSLDLHHVSPTTVWIAWIILCADNAFGIWGTVWNCLLQGIGYVGWDSIIASFVSASTITVQIVAVFLGGRLITLATVATVAAITQRLLLRGLARRRRPELFALQGRWNPALMRGVPGLAFRAWLTAVGTVLVFNTDGFLIASIEGAGNIPAYRACYLVVLNMQMLGVTFGTASSVFISHLWQAGDLPAVHRVVRRNLRLGLLIILCGSAWVLSLGATLFDNWLGHGKFVGYPILMALVVMFTLDVHSFIVAVSSRATEDEAFAAWFMAAGLLKIGLSWMLMQRFGLTGLALGTLFAQLCTNHWYTCYRGLKRLRIDAAEHARRVLLPCAGIFLGLLPADWLCVSLLRNSFALTPIMASAVLTGLVFGAGCWFQVLDPAERLTILRRCGVRQPALDASL